MEVGPYRFRARFERPPGDGAWFMEDTLLSWLDKRLGRNRYIFREEAWEGRARQAFALYFDDHTIIPDLMEHYAGITIKLHQPVTFSAKLTRSELNALRVALVGLQEKLVAKINIVEERALWTLGRCTYCGKGQMSEGERVMIGRINDLSSLNQSISTADELMTLTITDAQRGSIAVGLTVLEDMNPKPLEAIEPLRAFLIKLRQVE